MNKVKNIIFITVPVLFLLVLGIIVEVEAKKGGNNPTGNLNCTVGEIAKVNADGVWACSPDEVGQPSRAADPCIEPGVLTVPCPCVFEDVPKTTECWVNDAGTANTPEWVQGATAGGNDFCILNNELATITFPPDTALLIESTSGNTCSIIVDSQPGCLDDLFVVAIQLTQDELRTCICRLETYAAQLDSKPGITVTGNPFVCPSFD